jgi:hypothetical protein
MAAAAKVAAGRHNSERQRDAERKRSQRAAEREVHVPKCENRRRRKRLEKDDAKWLRWYFGETFWYAFTPQQAEMIAAIRNAILFGVDQAIAASRGEGKTALFERLLLKYALSGAIGFALLCRATGPMAEDSLNEIKEAIEENDRLCADYPEVCVPVRALEGAPQRAQTQLVSGWRHDTGKRFSRAKSRFSWCGHQIIFPNVPGSPSARAVFATRGLDAEVRGLKKYGRRPDVIGVDDPDTEETIYSGEQAKKLERRIDRGLAASGGQQRQAARIMLTTLQRITCVSAKFTDRKEKPSWNGKRFRFLVKPSGHPELCQEYVALVQSDQQEGDRYSRRAHQFYLDHQAEIEAGAEIANPNRFNGEKLADGSRREVSALQHYLNEVARIGQEAVSTEYDNDPPEEAQVQESGITPSRVQCQVSGYQRRAIPPGCTVLTQGIDVNKRYCHWVVRAWRPEPAGYATGFTVDYGITEVYGTKKGSDEGLDEALVSALHVRREELVDHPYAFESGELLEPQLHLVDSKWRKEAIFRFCDEAGWGWYPAVGYGRSTGCIAPNFREPVQSNQNKVMGWQAFSAPRVDGGWMVHIFADHYKAWEHDRWMSDPRRPGALLLFGEPGRGSHRSEMSDDERGHMAYAHHICAEIEVEEPIRGVMKRYWKPKSHNNHWLDASYRADCAAAMCGIRLYGMPAIFTPEEPGPAPVVTTPDGRPFCVLDRV